MNRKAWWQGFASREPPCGARRTRRSLMPPFRAQRQLSRYVLFALAALTINLADNAVLRAIADPRKRLIVAAGATLDIVLIVTAIYYWLLVRPGIRGRASLLPIALLGALRAALLFPDARVLTAVIAGLCETGLIAFVIVHVRSRARRHANRLSDPADALRTSLESLLAPPVARFVAAELSIFNYAFFSWRSKPHVPADARAFTLHEKSGHADLFYAVAALSVFEIFPMHLLLHHWRPAAAWIATGLSAYGMIWLIGLARSFRLRPGLISPDYLDVRYGLLFRLRIPRENIAAIRPATAGDAASATVIPRRSEPSLCIDLIQPMEAESLFGLRRCVRCLALAPDDATGFRDAATACCL